MLMPNTTSWTLRRGRGAQLSLHAAVATEPRVQDRMRTLCSAQQAITAARYSAAISAAFLHRHAFQSAISSHWSLPTVPYPRYVP